MAELEGVQVSETPPASLIGGLVCMTHNKHCTVRLDRSKYDRLVAIAAERECTASDLIRHAVDAFLGAGQILAGSQRRLARINEFQHLALDIIIREQFPEYRDRILAETDKRLRSEEHTSELQSLMRQTYSV